MNRVYHPWYLWEDYPANFYDNCSGEVKSNLIGKVIEMFNSEQLTYDNMFRVINEWEYSCEHNLTNESLNKIAYIGQGACCLYAGVPSTVTMEAWSLLTKEVQERSDSIAKNILKIWETKNGYAEI